MVCKLTNLFLSPKKHKKLLATLLNIIFYKGTTEDLLLKIQKMQKKNIRLLKKHLKKTTKTIMHGHTDNGSTLFSVLGKMNWNTPNK